MPRKTPTKYVETLGELDTQPVQRIAEYFSSKENDHLFMKPPLVNTIGFDIGSFYADAKLERESIQKFFDLLCQEQLAHKKVNATRLKLLKTDHAQLLEGFVKLNNLMRDLNDKKKVANTKIAEETEIQEKLRANIEAKMKTIDDLAVFRNELRHTTRQYQLYETVLHGAVEQSDNFDSAEDLINRCDAIMLAQVDITNFNSQLFDEIESMRKRVLGIIQQAKMMALGLKNLLILLDHSYSSVITEYLRWERMYSENAHGTIRNELQKERIWDAVYTLYRLLCKRSGTHPVHGRRPVEKNMDFIRDEVSLLQATIAEYNKRNNIPISVGIKVIPKC